MSARPARDLELWLVFAALAFVWGSSYLFIKLGLEGGLRPLTLVTLRLWLAVAFLVVLARLTGARLPRDVAPLVRVGLLGIFNVAIPFTLITWGELWIDSALASILNGLVPLFAMAFAAAVLPDEPITVNRLAGLLIGFGGAVVILSRDVGGGVTADARLVLLGELAVVLSCVAYAGSGVYIRRFISGRPLVVDPARGYRPLSPVEIAIPQNVVAAMVVTVAALAMEGGDGAPLVLPASGQAWFAVAWLALLGSGVAYLLFFRLIDRWGATRTALVAYAMPVVGIGLGVTVKGETIDPQVLAGAALVIGGIALVSRRTGDRPLLARPGRAAELRE